MGITCLVLSSNLSAQQCRLALKFADSARTSLAPQEAAAEHTFEHEIDEALGPDLRDNAQRARTPSGQLEPIGGRRPLTISSLRSINL
jgi:hypothetical protein